MGAAAKSGWAVVFLMMLSLGVCLCLPTEDVLDAVYDESETLPYEGAPSFSIVLSPVGARPSQAALESGFQVRLGSLTGGCEGRAGDRTWPAHPASDSITILDRALRC